MPLTTPILFLVFNRPDTTARVFERIREAQPKQLFVAADGPRDGKEGEAELCNQVRQMATNVDWDCEVKTLFRNNNLGCKVAVSEGIGWFFDNVEQGIILEDDTLPHPDFFTFCQSMLELYKNDDRVWHISGYNVAGEWNTKNGYLLTHFGTIWGWASWKKAWKHYDSEILAWSDIEVQNLILNKYFKGYSKARKQLYDQLYNGQIDTWDLQWAFARLLHDKLSIVPAVNLVENIGLESGTHFDQMDGNRALDWAVKKNTPNIKIEFTFIKDLLIDNQYNNYFLSLLPKDIVENGFKKRLSNFIKKLLGKKANIEVSIDKVEQKLTKNISFIGSRKPKMYYGRRTYFNGLKIYCWRDSFEISIGNYCCFADDITIIAGGEHDKQWVSSYPFIDVFDIVELRHLISNRSKGNIRIGNDVWIATGVTILSGVSIGDGAVIGAGAVVVKDVPPYTIVGGNPQKIIKYRFEQERINHLLEIKWWKWPEKKILSSLNNINNIDLFIDHYKRSK